MVEDSPLAGLRAMGREPSKAYVRRSSGRIMPIERYLEDSAIYEFCGEVVAYSEGERGMRDNVYWRYLVGMHFCQAEEEGRVIVIYLRYGERQVVMRW